MRAARSCICWLLVVALSGCATRTTMEPPADVGYQSRIGRLAIVVTQRQPEVRFEGFVRSKEEGAAAGARRGSSFCDFGGGGGVEMAIALIIMLGICSISVTTATIAGAARAPTAELAGAGERKLQQRVEGSTLRELLRQALVDGARSAGLPLAGVPEDAIQQAAANGDYGLLEQHGTETVLEAALTDVGTRATGGPGINDPSIARVIVMVRLLDVTTGEVLFTSHYEYDGRRLDLAGWAADDAQPFARELVAASRRLGEFIPEDACLGYPLATSFSMQHKTLFGYRIGLAAIEPPQESAAPGSPDPAQHPEQQAWPVAGVRPTFRWEAFPRAQDIAVAPEAMSRVRQVTYELVVAREENGVPAEIVFQAAGLTSNELDLPSALQPHQKYFWTVRPHFVLDGKARVSDWAATSPHVPGPQPTSHSYRFMTP